jgi:hypothetical protein
MSTFTESVVEDAPLSGGLYVLAAMSEGHA